MNYFLDKKIPNDSLELMDFIMDIEDHFDIVISQTEIAEIHSMEDLMKLVEEKTNE